MKQNKVLASSEDRVVYFFFYHHDNSIQYPLVLLLTSFERPN